MSKLISRFRLDDRGATAIEYGLIASIVSIGILTALSSIGGDMVQRYEAIATAVGSTP